MGLKQRL